MTATVAVVVVTVVVVVVVADEAIVVAVVLVVVMSKPVSCVFTSPQPTANSKKAPLNDKDIHLFIRYRHPFSVILSDAALRRGFGRQPA